MPDPDVIINTLRHRCTQLESELMLHRAKAKDEYWAWQGDGSDFPETLSCPVLISASDLREMLSCKR